LAKIGRATFSRLVRPGEQLVYDATIANVSPAGASIQGVVRSRSAGADGTISEVAVGEVELMFSHIDQNMAGMKFPEFNFVFNSEFMALFETYRRNIDVTL
jgi:hypothetical protein